MPCCVKAFELKIFAADFCRFSQIRNRTIHRRDAEYAEEIPFAQSGDDDWAKTFSSNLKNIFVCRRLPTNKKLILCVLCVSAVIFLKGFLSVSICVNLRLIAFDALRLSLSDLASAVNILKKSVSVCVRLRLSAVKYINLFCVYLRLIAFDALRSALSALLPGDFAMCFVLDDQINVVLF